MAATSSGDKSYRRDIALRVFLAFVGGFFVISGGGGLLASLFYRAGLGPLAQGVHILTLTGFVFWCALAMWVFYESRIRVVSISILGAAVILPLSSLLLSSLLA